MKHIFLILSCVATLVTTDRVIVTNNGLLQGVTVFSGETEVEAFLGVPYAEPPVDRLRFRKPVPKGLWTGVYKAFHQPPPCMQYIRNRYYEPSSENMTEDCLFLSLWVPYSRTTELKPIIVFTHGGSFNLGSGNMPLYVGTNLAKFGDVIVANLNYRLGALGFLLTYHEDADGNMGVYDQILATRWIKDNAQSFGGDPNRIVLMGESAGATMVGTHLVSPLTRNLFKRVILESGNAMIPYFIDNEVLFNNSRTFAVLAGCANNTVSLRNNPSVIQCLKSLPSQKLVEAEGNLIRFKPFPFFIRSGDAYLPKPVIYLLQEGKFQDKEMLIGSNEFEGSFLLVEGSPEYFGKFGKDGASSISRRLAFYLLSGIFSIMDKKNNKNIARHYIHSIENGTSESYVKAMAGAIGDYFVTCNNFFHAEFHSMRNPVYFYVFKHRPSTSPNAEWMGTTHIDELQYVFGNSMFGNFTPEEASFSERIMARWSAFARTGNPNVPGFLEWPAFTRKNPVYLDIQLEDSVHLRPENYTCEFWRNMFKANFDSDMTTGI